jgi:hypothetical protein
VSRHQYFGRIFCFHLQGLKILSQDGRSKSSTFANYEYLHNAVSDYQCLLSWPFTFSFNVNHASSYKNRIFRSSNLLTTNFCNHLQYRLLLSHSKQRTPVPL